MNADEYKRLAAAEATIDAIRTALGGKPDSDLVSLAIKVTRQRDAAEVEVARLLDELSSAADGHWDAEPSWYADKVLNASPYIDGDK